MESSTFPGPLDPATWSAAAVARALALEPLPREGGWFRRTYASELAIPAGSLPSLYAGARRTASAILALLTPEGFSALHRLASDEIWCFHCGDPLESLRLHPDGSGEWVVLGLDLASGQRFQDVVPAHAWQGTRLRAGGRWALVSCVVTPEFVWDDFELGEREALKERYPAFAEGVAALTR
jgi:predicted cupin superfamily sugar epimerase